ncbi:hypothetical protein NDU88_006404 [Pleurodeles waltl]|uniref:Uncharacterized protein n=1 Tax=Pleurodeles waltl TaxID=8319 RepID=A0AAV7NT63_PLEWA|nr:hypothetical protein NDU88_006404 [Pleurodeles waltl]
MPTDRENAAGVEVYAAARSGEGVLFRSAGGVTRPVGGATGRFGRSSVSGWDRRRELILVRGDGARAPRAALAAAGTEGLYER